MISLCMIVRDNETTIEAAILSAKPWVDEIIVVDTGSKDQTPEICRRLGAQVHFMTWPDSFSAARNESLRYATGDWIFWMDSDDSFPADQGARMRALVDSDPPPEVLGFNMKVHCPYASEDGDVGVTAVDHCKLFRNRPDLRFEFRIHEQILPSIDRAGGVVVSTDIYVIHSGAERSPAGLRRKLHRDVRLLKLENRERPDHPFALFNIGMTMVDCGRYRLGTRALWHCISVSGGVGSHVRKAYALLAGAFMAISRADEALAACQEGLSRFPDDPELLFRSGVALHALRRLSESERAYLDALDSRSKYPISSVDLDFCKSC